MTTIASHIFGNSGCRRRRFSTPIPSAQGNSGVLFGRSRPGKAVAIRSLAMRTGHAASGEARWAEAKTGHAQTAHPEPATVTACPPEADPICRRLQPQPLPVLRSGALGLRVKAESCSQEGDRSSPTTQGETPGGLAPKGIRACVSAGEKEGAPDPRRSTSGPSRCRPRSRSTRTGGPCSRISSSSRSSSSSSSSRNNMY